MRGQILRKQGDNVTLQTVYDPSEIYRKNYLSRMNGHKGFTKERTRQQLADIPIDDLNALITSGDLDAIVFNESSGKEAKTALNKLLARFPEWRC
jgi:hypothetical protein